MDSDNFNAEEYMEKIYNDFEEDCEPTQKVGLFADVKVSNTDWNAIGRMQAKQMFDNKENIDPGWIGVYLLNEAAKQYVNRVIKEELYWKCELDKSVYVRTNGYYCNLHGECPIHHYKHSHNHACLVQPSNPIKNARLICPHRNPGEKSGRVTKLDYNFTVLMQ